MKAVELLKCEQGSSEWLEARRSFIGGSDAAVALGMSQYKTAYQLYKEKTGESDGFYEENEAMRWGKELEPILRQRYADRTGKTVRVPESILQHPRYEFMIASLDGLTDCGRVFEAKTARHNHGWGEAGSSEIPQGYLIQVQHYLAVTGLQICDLEASIAGAPSVTYTIERDKELIEMIIDAEYTFWQHVKQGIPPEPMTYDEVRERYSTSKGGEIYADAETMALIHSLARTKQKIKQLEEDEQKIKAEIMKFMGENEALLFSSYQGHEILATWKNRAGSNRLDTKALAESYPEIVAAFTRRGEPTRTFLLK